jgi:hypothetical protein
LNWPIKVVGGDSFEESGGLRDLSCSGAFAYLNHFPDLHSTLSISIRLPLEVETWMNYSAIVVRVDNATDAPGIALRFNSSKPEFKRVGVEDL